MNLNLAFSYSPNLDLYSIYSKDAFPSPFKGLGVKQLYITGGTTIFSSSIYLETETEEVHICPSIKYLLPNAIYKSYESSTKFYFDDMNSYLGIRSISPRSSIGYISDNIYINNEKLDKSIIVPEGVVEIPDYAFYNLRNIEEISIPSSLRKIGYDAFKSYGSVKTNYYEHGFYIGDSKNPYQLLVYTSDDLYSFTFHPDCQAFTNNSFNRCITTLSQVQFNENITAIPDYAFSPKQFEEFGETVTKLSSVVFSGGNNISFIGNYAFADTCLTSLTFSEKISFIGMRAFDTHTEIANITWPETVDNLIIGSYALRRTTFNELVIPNGTIFVGNGIYTSRFTSKVLVYIPSSLIYYPTNDNPYDYWLSSIGSFISCEHEYEDVVVAPAVFFEGNEADYPNLMDVIEDFFYEYGSIGLTYNENLTYYRGWLFTFDIDSNEYVFAGYARAGQFATSNAIPNSFHGQSISTCRFGMKDTHYLQLSTHYTKLYLNEDTPTKIVVCPELTDVIMETANITFNLFLDGEVEDNHMQGITSNVNVYYYSATENKDGKHWRYTTSGPAVW